MKIIIRQKEFPRRLFFWVPNALLTASWLQQHLPCSKESVQLPNESMRIIKKELKKMKRKHPDVPLVEVHSSSGEEITIWP